MTSFRDYLSKRRVGASPAGEFTRQVRDEPEMEKIESWAQHTFIERLAPTRSTMLWQQPNLCGKVIELLH